MRRRWTIWAVVGLGAGAASLTHAASPDLQGPASVFDRAQRLNPTFEEDLTPEERATVEMVTLVNVERGSRGLPFLRIDDRMTRAALGHAADMAANRRMQHLGTDGSDGGIRLTDAGYVWSSWGENIGAGFVDPATLFRSWMNSDTHRSNLLGDFTDIGVGAVATPDGVPYWALVVAGSPYVPGQF